MKTMKGYKLAVDMRKDVPSCRERYCDEETHWVRVTVYLDGKIVFEEPEYKTFKKGA